MHNEANVSVIGVACVAFVVVVVTIATLMVTNNQVQVSTLNNTSVYYNNTQQMGPNLDISYKMIFAALLILAALAIVGILLVMIGGRGL